MDYVRNEISSVNCEGHGETTISAISSALGNISKNLLKNHSKKVFLKVTPKEIQSIQLEEYISTEYFLFFFFPKFKKEFVAKININVLIETIEIDSIPITKQVKKNSFGFSELKNRMKGMIKIWR